MKQKGRFVLAAVCVLLAAGAASGAYAKKAKKLKVNPAKEQVIKAAKARYTQLPDLPKCQAGQLAASEKRKVLDTLNAIRALHGLDPVVYDEAYDQEVMDTALMIVVNGSISHNPPENWLCYTAAGAVGAGTSNLHRGSDGTYASVRSGDQDVIDWIVDLGNLKGGVGHRIWLLNPFMKSIAYGNVSVDVGASNVHASAIRVFDGQPLYDYSDPDSHPYETPRIIAYPFQDYPSRYYQEGAIMSFAAVLDRNNVKNGGFDFSGASVVLTPDKGKPVTAKVLGFDGTFGGLPQTLQFDPGPIRAGMRYKVMVKGVKVGGESRDFSYWFRIAS